MFDIGKLRLIESSELEIIRSWRNDPSIRKNMYSRHEISADEHARWWKKISEREDQKYFMYEYLGVPYGVVSFNSIDRVNSNSAWAFYASPSSPKGTGSRMEFLAIDYVFHELKLYKLYCEVLDFNSAVIKLHQKFGFQVEGVFRQHHKIDDGYASIVRLGLLYTEWESKREEMLNRLLSLNRG